MVVNHSNLLSLVAIYCAKYIFRLPEKYLEPIFIVNVKGIIVPVGANVRRILCPWRSTAGRTQSDKRHRAWL